MKTGLKVALAVAGVLLAATVAGIYLTSNNAPAVHWTRKGAKPQSKRRIVSQGEWRTAKTLAGSTLTRQEDEIAQEAVRLTDHQVDLAFTCALLEDDLKPVAVGPEVKAAEQRIKELEALLKQDEADSARKQALADKKPDDEDLQSDAEMADAMLALHQDDLASAHQDLLDAGGDIATRIKNERAWHEKTDKTLDTATPRMLPLAYQPEHSLGKQMQQWWSLLQRQRQVQATKEKAYDTARTLKAPQLATDPQGQDPNDKWARAEKVRREAELRRLETAYEQRRQDELQLAQAYEQWEQSLATSRKAVLHAGLLNVVGILLLALAVLLTEVVLARITHHTTKLDRRRLGSLRMAARVAVQFVALLLILLIIFGPPQQISTIIALATAGLTVVMKDFILAFFGWFVLMGRNGIRVGDWVEINGIGGEVVEIGVLRTMLLETGNWSDSSHPTGRKVAFVNSFAIEGHYFNFTTSGQWLWDELQVVLPVGIDTLPLVDQVRALVAEETKNEATQAESEWSRVTHHLGVKPLSAAPALDVRPSSGGVQVTVRYIVNAASRFDVRSRLYHEIVEMLHKRAS